MFWRNGAFSWDTGQQVDHGALDGGGVFEGCKVDAFCAEWSGVEVDFLQLIEEQVRKAGSHLEVEKVVCGKVGFSFFCMLNQVTEEILEMGSQSVLTPSCVVERC